MAESPSENFITTGLPRLYKLYRDPTSQLYLQKDTNILLKLARQDAALFGVTRRDILYFKRAIGTL
jgi:hypothetical protein